MLANSTTEVGVRRSKREFLTVSVRRSRGGVTLRAKCDPQLEQFYADLARPEPDESPATVGSTKPGWSGYTYYVLPTQSTLGRYLVDDNGHRAATLEALGTPDLGRPDQMYDFPLNLSWLRTVNLSTTGFECEFPHVWTMDVAKQFTQAVAVVVRKLYRDKMQPFDITVSITVEESGMVTG